LPGWAKECAQANKTMANSKVFFMRNDSIYRAEIRLNFK
jgi:hypothetical protein